MQGTRILIVGCGDIGIPLARLLVDQGASVWGLRRQPEVLPDFIHPLAADVTQPQSLAVLDDQAFDYVVTTLTPAGFSEAGYRTIFESGIDNLLARLQQQPTVKRILHVSSTSVYHQSEGEWVDENSPTEPSGFSGKSLLAAEARLAASSIPATVIRFAGIYGPGRKRLIEQVRSGQGCPKQPVLYTNRIHRDDCVGVLAHLLALDHNSKPPEPLYIGVDSNPVPMWEVKHWLAEQLGVELDDEAVTVSRMRRSSKRCSNERLLASGYELLYPGFRDGYLDLINQH